MVVPKCYRAASVRNDVCRRLTFARGQHVAGVDAVSPMACSTAGRAKNRQWRGGASICLCRNNLRRKYKCTVAIFSLTCRQSWTRSREALVEPGDESSSDERSAVDKWLRQPQLPQADPPETTLRVCRVDGQKIDLVATPDEVKAAIECLGAGADTVLKLPGERLTTHYVPVRHVAALVLVPPKPRSIFGSTGKSTSRSS